MYQERLKITQQYQVLVRVTEARLEHSGSTGNGAATLEESLQVSYKDKNRLSHDPAIPLLSINLRETGTDVHTENVYMNIYSN